MDEEKVKEEMLYGDQKDLPDRVSAERNSVYKLAGEDRNAENLKNLPDREIAERNSVYKLAREAKERWGGDDTNPAKTWETNGQRPDTINRIPSADRPNRANRSQDDFDGSKAGDGEKENNLHETVTLNTDPIDGPGKLDNL